MGSTALATTRRDATRLSRTAGVVSSTPSPTPTPSTLHSAPLAPCPWLLTLDAFLLVISLHYQPSAIEQWVNISNNNNGSSSTLNTHTHTPNTYTPHTHTHTCNVHNCCHWLLAMKLKMRNCCSKSWPSAAFHRSPSLSIPLFLSLSLFPISTCNGIYFVAHFHVGCESNHAQSASQYLEYDISQKSTHKAIATTTTATTIRKPKMKFCMRLPGIKTTTITLVRSCRKLWADKADTL